MLQVGPITRAPWEWHSQYNLCQRVVFHDHHREPHLDYSPASEAEIQTQATWMGSDQVRLRASREFTFFFRIPQQKVLPLIREPAIHPSLPREIF